MGNSVTMTNADGWYDLIIRDVSNALGVSISNYPGKRGFDEGIIVFNCPACNDAKRRGWINLKNGTAGCFRASCVVRGPIGIRKYARLLAGHGVISDASASKVASCILSASGSHTELTAGSLGVKDWPREVKLDVRGELSELDYSPWKVDLMALRAFGFKRWRLGRLSGIFIPIEMHENLVAYLIRLDDSRYLFLSADGIKKGSLLFGFDMLPKLANCVIVVESAADAVSVLERYSLPCVSTLGSRVTNQQATAIARAGIKNVIIAFDSDATERAAEDALRLIRMRLFDNVVVGTWVGGKDASRGGRLVI